MRNKRVLVLLYNPFTHDSRVLKECVSLIKAGYEVDLWALHKDGLKEKEIIQGINVYRRFKLLLIKTKNTSGLFSGLYNASLALCKTLYNLHYLYFSNKHSLFQVFKDGNYSYIHCNDVAPLKFAVTLKFQSSQNIKLIYDCHEYEAAERPNNGLKNWLLNKIASFIETLYIKHVDSIITVSNGIADEYERLYGIKRPGIVMNCSNYIKTPNAHDHFRKLFNIRKDQTIFLYQGALSPGRGIEMIIEAFQKINDPTKVVVFMGYGNLESIVQQATNKYHNIYYLPAVPPDVVLEYTASADIGISWIENICLSYHYCLPNKLFEYIMAGIPAIYSNLHEMSKLCAHYKTGVVANEISIDGLIDSINKISSMDLCELKQSVNKTKKVFSWENQENTLLEIYKKL